MACVWAAGCWWGTGGHGAGAVAAALAGAGAALVAALTRRSRRRPLAVRTAAGDLVELGRPALPALLVLLAVLCAGFVHGALSAHPPQAARLADHPRGAGGPWQVRGRLAGDPMPLGRAWQVDLQVEAVRVDGAWRTWPLRVRTTVYAPPAPGSWPAGAGFEAFLALRPQRGARNPLIPDRPDLRAAGADVRASLKSFRQLRRRQTAPLPQRWRSALRAALRDAVAKRFGDDAPLVHALMLGERGSVAPGFDDVLARTGLVHLLAISGLHVGIVVGAAFALLRGIGLPRPHAALAVAATLPLLHALVVPRPPVARATLMAAVVLLGVASGRRGTALNGLALATVVLTATDPWGTRNFGFQLSSAATAGILLIARVAQQGGRVRRWLCAALAVSAAAQLAVAPLIAAASFRLPLASLPLNLPAVPLTATVLIAAPAALVAAALHCEPLAAAATDVARAALAGLRHLAEAADHRVSAATVPARATPWIGAAALATIGLLASRRPRDAGLRRTGSRHGRGWPEAYGRRGRAVARARAALLLATCLLSAAAGRALTIAHGAPADGFRLIAFDAGQGDALLVETAGARVLIDTSGSPGSDFDPGTALLAPALRARGVDRLDAVVISHLHADHAGGLAGLLAEIDTAAVWTAPFDPAAPAGRAFTAALGDVPLRIALRGSVMALGRDPDGGEAPCGWRALHPAAGFRPPRGRPQSNDESLVLALQCGNRSLLLTGDAEQGAEDAYVPELTLPAGTVLKSPHHGSATSSGSALLTTTATRHVVVSAGWRNRFGLPDAEVLERYRARRIAVYRTDRDGAVTLTAGARTRVRAERWTAGRGHPITGGWLH